MANYKRKRPRSKARRYFLAARAWFGNTKERFRTRESLTREEKAKEIQDYFKTYDEFVNPYEDPFWK